MRPPTCARGSRATTPTWRRRSAAGVEPGSIRALRTSIPPRHSPIFACRYWSCRAPPIPTVRSRRCARGRRSATARSERWCCPASATLRIARIRMQRLARSRRLPTVSFVFTAKGSTARSDCLSPERIARAADMHYNSYRTIELSREFSGSEPMDEAEARNGVVDFRTEPSRYRHWKLAVDGEVATLTMDVDEKAGLLGGYELKLNSY